MPPTSLTERVQTAALGHHVLAAGFIGQEPVFAATDGRVRFGLGDGSRTAEAHADGMLAAVVEKNAVLSGGEDGRVVRTAGDGSMATLGDEKGRWIDALASGPDGSAAWSTGKAVTARSGKGEIRTVAMPSTARGLAFLPKGYRLAVAHYNGASLCSRTPAQPPEPLVWKVRISTSPCRRTGATSSPPCRRMRFTAGGSTTRRTCA